MTNLLHLSGDDGESFEVLEFTDEAKRDAAQRLIDHHFGDFDNDIPKTVAWLASKAQGDTLREHTSEPTDCACEDKGWWCPYGDGDRRKFYSFEVRDLYDEIDRRAHEEADAS